MTPGLIDTHIDFTGVDELFSIDLSDPNIKAMNDVVSRVAAQVARTKPGEWVLGERLGRGQAGRAAAHHRRRPRPVSPNNPVWLGNTTGHYGVGNTYAMKIAEIAGARPTRRRAPSSTTRRASPTAWCSRAPSS